LVAYRRQAIERLVEHQNLRRLNAPFPFPAAAKYHAGKDAFDAATWRIDMVSMPAGAPSLDEILVQTETMPWREKSLQGVSEKMLWRNEETGASIAMIKFDKGAGIPAPHYHASNQFMICLKGRYEYTKTGVTLTAGSFYCNPKGNVHGPAIAHEETIVIEVYDGPHYPFKPDFYADERDAH